MISPVERNLISDEELSILLRSSNHSAYTEIYERYSHLMLSQAYKKLHDKELAKDIVQEVFVNLWQKRDQVLPTNNLAPFLFVSLRNRIIDHFLHSDVKSKYITSLANHLSHANTATTDHLIREKQLNEYLEKQVKALPKKMRQVFELSKVEHLSNTEIAQQLETTESNVSQHVNNALRILRVKLGTFLTLF